MTERNAPCPCGSGRKYKRCCLQRDADSAHALHLLGADRELSATGGGQKFPAGELWEADILPVAMAFEDDPTARPVAAIVTGNGFVLHADILARGPSESADVAAAIAESLEKARFASLDSPRIVEVRYSVVADALARLVGPELQVRTNATLAGVDDAVSSFEANVLGGNQPSGLRMSRPDTWAAWELGDDRMRRLFAAAAAYHRAAPWQNVDDDATIEAVVAGGGTWYLSILGGAGETFGIGAYASLADIEALFESVEPDGGLSNASDAVLSLTFGPASDLSRQMRREIRAAQWEIAGEFAYPFLMVLHTPAGGITARQADDLIEILRFVPAFIAGDVSDNAAVHFEWVAVTPDVGLWQPPAVLTPALCRGAGTDPLLANGATHDVMQRLAEWLATPHGTKAPAKSTVSRHMKAAGALTEFMEMAHGTTPRTISELDLRAFLYDHALRGARLGEAALDQLRGSLKRFFAFLAEREQIECPWAAEILDDAERFELRRLDYAAAVAVGDEAEWRLELTRDLASRVLIPESVTEDGVDWAEAVPSRDMFALFQELMRRWLVWRDDAIAAGVTTPDEVVAIAAAKQLDWQRTVHPAFGRSPAEVLKSAQASTGRSAVNSIVHQ